MGFSIDYKPIDERFYWYLAIKHVNWWFLLFFVDVLATHYIG
jgi:hypothetical protein